MASTTDSPQHIVLPDLVSYCPFPLHCQPNAHVIDAACSTWFHVGCPELLPKKRAAVYGLRTGILTAYCLPNSDDQHLHVVSDFLVFLFHLDNISDMMMARGTEQLANIVMNAHWFPQRYMPTGASDKEQPKEEPSAGKLARDFWSRCIQDAKPGVQARFKENLEMYFEAVQRQTEHRDLGIVPDLKLYIDIRRDTSGCKSAFDLIEYAMGIELPEFVVNNVISKALNQSANNLVSWSNDIFSYNVEQARDDSHNLTALLLHMVVILMRHHGLSLQQAVDRVGDLCKQTIDTFVENQRRIPSWGQGIDADVAVYVEALQDWIVGGLHWSFMTERYFGKDGAEIKKQRVVKLMQKVESDNVIE